MGTCTTRVPLHILLAVICLHSFGIATESVTGRIYHGYPVEVGDATCQVSLRWKDKDLFYFGMGHFCGGTLISSDVVLTAAHCLTRVVNSTQLSVVMGSNLLHPNTRTNETLVYDVKEYVIHRSFNAISFVGDIAYIVLDKKVPNNLATIQPIPLIDRVVPEGTLCQVTGWGYTENRTLPNNLLAVEIPILDINLCNVGYNGTLKAGQICAGYMEGQKDACNGDSGGPLMCDGKLTGIVSMGKGCGLPNKPGIYTDVWFYIDWIQGLNTIRKLETLNKSTHNGAHFGKSVCFIQFIFFISALIYCSVSSPFIFIFNI